MYILVLDGDNDPNNWIYVFRSDNLEDVLSLPCYDPASRRQMPKAERVGTFVESKLIPSCNGTDGSGLSGRVYHIQNFISSDEMVI